ncbi:hypothetical protein K402DRAFT_422318 [Aulographum hederae CBS 113979]|uniref:Family c-likeg-protein-coupled receptor protein n=1 Tax=Aulographum hederae CBS 113979 TaxID=1176131 RepID=A0A6G1GW85_9PEZI|nr:hypothetical protein K402DRAFT_422318 [Aulographum hederae CBS 113979]
MDAAQLHQNYGNGPYPSPAWSLGGRPTVGVDVPITAVFLVLFIAGAATHMTIFQLNRRKGHKFLMSALIFGFCMARIVTCTMRISSICLPQDLDLALAAQIFVAAGVVILYIVNLIFAQRIIRAQHPRWGWNKAFSFLFPFSYFVIVATIIILIVSVVQMSFTMSPSIRSRNLSMRLYGTTMFSVISFLPIPLVLLSLVVPRRVRVDKFGSGRLRTKIAVLLSASILVCLGATYRCATGWLPAVLTTQPLPAYYAKAAFYMMNFGVEVIVVYLYAFIRVDRRFHVPDGAHGKGAYSGKSGNTESRIYTEEETFDDAPATEQGKLGSDVETAVGTPVDATTPSTKVRQSEDENTWNMTELLRTAAVA